MKSFEISRGQVGAGIVPVAPHAVPTSLPAPRADKVQLEPAANAPVAAGLAHTAPSVGQQELPTTTALDVLSSQKADAPHRRGRTAALRVRDVKTEADASTKRAFKPLVELAGPLQDALAQFGIKR